MLKRLLTITTFLALLQACTPSTKSTSSSSPELKGWYKIKVKHAEEMLDSLKEEGTVIEKLFGSFATLLEVKVYFSETGYMRLGGNYGLLDFTTTLAEGDSSRFTFRNDTLFLNNAEFNGQDFAVLKDKGQGVFEAKLDSAEFFLIPE